MKNPRIMFAGAAALALAGTTTGCVTDPNTGEQKISRTAIGGVLGGAAGAILGDVIGGKTGRIIGAGVGGVGGAVVGKQFDDQIKELKEQTEGSGVSVTEVGDGEAILVNLPDGVTFAVNSAEISPGFQTTLDQIANSLVTYPNSLVDVMGHTDSTGSDSYNLDLSNRRASAVKNYLAMRGVSSARIESVGYGEAYPVASNDTPEGRARNRRVEIKITPITQEDVAEAQAAQ